ncbi:hypothetical protein PRVXT_001587 [Proteinivorax tanatarense]|uniref:Uncharacterized protein n=1 Tax=Proteinivorax tanatarense TaxID=1260629 RepID=A0AAU7VHR8_9FIRM
MEKPRCSLVGQNGNIFNLMGIAAKTLKEAGREKEADEMVKRTVESKNYNKALGIIMEYVEVE